MTKLKALLLGAALWLGALAPALAVIPTTSVGDAAYTLLSTDVYVRTSVAFTTARTWTLNPAGQTCIGQNCAPPAFQLQIADIAGAITATNTLTIAPASGDTINGNAANLVLSAPGVTVFLIPTSPSNWQAYVQGDYISSTVASGSAVSITTATAVDIATISLSQGLWSCTAVVSRTLGASTSVTILSASLGPTLNTIVAQGTTTSRYLQTAANVMGALGQDTFVGPVELAPTATTTYHLVAKDTFSVSTDAGYGNIYCERLR